MAQRVLVISPHPDDESIGCGGTLCLHVKAGDRVALIFLTSGEAGGHGRTREQTLKVREAEARSAARLLKLSPIEFWRQPDGALRVTDALIKRLRAAIVRFKPDIIYLPHDREMHPDHRAAVRLLRRALVGVKRPPNVLMFEVWTPLQRMNHIVDISPYIKTKLRAIRLYKSQNGELAFDDAFLGLARYRGEMHSWPGGNYAEVFAKLPRGRG
jgi:LmbE family N-acetylglucosaminyl deacetylase